MSLTHRAYDSQNVNLSVPSFDIPALSGLENVTIGTKLEQTLKDLNSTLPNLNEIRTKLNSLYVLTLPSTGVDLLTNSCTLMLR